ncbi:MAG: diadenosine tetraphosphate hydrolase [Cyanobacteriota bacterium]|nr:diadenosine tetraphosphate hydrolase [Cyanobacteriota bacterium]
MPDAPCAICQLHGDGARAAAWEIGRGSLWLLRHHPDPAPLAGWLLLDARRHLGGPLAFSDQEARAWGLAVRHASQLVQRLTGCERVYGIAFGEGAPHLHLHLIPRHAAAAASAAWRVADLYRAVEQGGRPPADPAEVRALVGRARELVEPALLDGPPPG